jgi:hypothetical protein
MDTEMTTPTAAAAMATVVIEPENRHVLDVRGRIDCDRSFPLRPGNKLFGAVRRATSQVSL